MENLMKMFTHTREKGKQDASSNLNSIPKLNLLYILSNNIISTFNLLFRVWESINQHGYNYQYYIV